MSEDRLAITSAKPLEAVPLPRSATHVDVALVDRAAEHINQIVKKTLARGMDEVGRCLLHDFYDDDAQAYLSSNPNKHMSLRRLLDRCGTAGLPVGKTFLANALRMAAVSGSLPRSNAFHHLGPSHRVALLPVRDPTTVERLALRAIEEDLSVVRLRALIRREKARDDRRGRRPVPELLKALRSCKRALGSDAFKFTRADVQSLGSADRERVTAALHAVNDRLAELRGLLR